MRGCVCVVRSPRCDEDDGTCRMSADYILAELELGPQAALRPSALVANTRPNL